MKILFDSASVDDQEKALNVFTRVLGFVKKEDVTAGEYRWLTVVPPDDQDGAEWVQQPNRNPAAEQYPKAIFERGIPAAMVGVDDLQAECERLKELGVQIKVEPTDYGYVSLASFDDTSGNLIQIQQRLRRLADRPGSIGCQAP